MGKVFMTAIDFIKQVKNTNKSAKCYFIQTQTFEDVEGSDPREDETSEIYFSEEDARAAVAALLPILKAEFGEYISVNLMCGTVYPEDLEGIDWKAIEDFGVNWFSDSDLFDIINENDSLENVDYFYVEYEYKNLEGSILVFWSWQTYVGYCRKCVEIRYAYSNENESICIKKDKVNHTQCDVLCSAEELEGQSKEDIVNLVNQKLGESHWKWRNNAYRVAERFAAGTPLLLGSFEITEKDVL